MYAIERWAYNGTESDDEGPSELLDSQPASSWAQALAMLDALGAISPAAYDMAPESVVHQVNDTNGGELVVRVSPNLGDRSGSVGTGDLVIAGGSYATVTRVTTVPPGHSVPTIRRDLTAVIVETDSGKCRYLGADRAWIGSDLRMHWTRA